ncbi:hypothetical protein CYMTET_33641, partial [Cymbomonas tetramitiformis]
MGLGVKVRTFTPTVSPAVNFDEGAPETSLLQRHLAETNAWLSMYANQEPYAAATYQVVIEVPSKLLRGRRLIDTRGLEHGKRPSRFLSEAHKVVLMLTSRDDQCTTMNALHSANIFQRLARGLQEQPPKPWLCMMVPGDKHLMSSLEALVESCSADNAEEAEEIRRREQAKFDERNEVWRTQLVNRVGSELRRLRVPADRRAEDAKSAVNLGATFLVTFARAALGCVWAKPPTDRRLSMCHSSLPEFYTFMCGDTANWERGEFLSSGLNEVMSQQARRAAALLEEVQEQHLLPRLRIGRLEGSAARAEVTQVQQEVASATKAGLAKWKAFHTDGAGQSGWWKKFETELGEELLAMFTSLTKHCTAEAFGDHLAEQNIKDLSTLRYNKMPPEIGTVAPSCFPEYLMKRLVAPIDELLRTGARESGEGCDLHELMFHKLFEPWDTKNVGFPGQASISWLKDFHWAHEMAGTAWSADEY